MNEGWYSRHIPAELVAEGGHRLTWEEDWWAFSVEEQEGTKTRVRKEKNEKY